MNVNLKEIFDKSRQELLDMGLRGNTLLNVGKGTKILDIVDEKSEQVFEHLVEDTKMMSFLPAPDSLDKEDSQSISLADLTTHLEEKNGDKRHSDNALQTQLFRKQLDTRLLKLSTEATTFIQEQGVDLLYLAMGFIKWFEDDNSDKPRYAPLVLIPVEIFRADAGDAYKIRYTESELGTNLTLAAKLKMEFGIVLSEFVEGEDGYDFQSYLDSVANDISGEKRWSVESNKIVLSFFSFGKFQMYQDLSDEVWPEGKKPSENGIIQKLFSEGFERDVTLLDSTPMDVNRAEEVQLILDSDSSQTEAVLAAKSGANLVIQGPPGTGKSQTITNIISQALSDNKKVLFVAEKMAALDVVKRRLDNCNIGGSVLELHSHKANKKSVLSSLESTLMQHVPVIPERSEDIDRLVSLRNKLDDYCLSVNESISNTEVSYHDALGYSSQLERIITDASIDLDELPSTDFDLNVWDKSYYLSALAKINEVVDYLSEHNAPSLNLFSSTNLKDYSPSDDKLAQKLVSELKDTQQEIINQIKGLHTCAGYVSPITNYTDCITVLEGLCLIADRPELESVDSNSSAWESKGDAIFDFALQGATLQDQKAELSEHFVDSALDYDWMSVRGSLLTTGQKWWRFLSGDYRRAKSSYAGMCKNGLVGGASEWIENIDAALEYRSTQKCFIDSAQLAIDTIGSHFKNESTDWKAMLKPLQWVQECHAGIKSGALDNSVAQYLDPSKEISFTTAELDQVKILIDKRSNLMNELALLLRLDLTTFVELSDVLPCDDVETIGSDIEKFYPLTRFNRLGAELEAIGLSLWKQQAFSWTNASTLIRDCFKFTFYNSLVEHQYSLRDEIRYFDRVEHEKQIEQFSSIDGQLFYFTQESLVKQLYDNLPNPSARGEVETLRREFNKKRRQMPIRRLLNKTGRVIQQIKPVFMMSPMSIATYLEPGVVDFDLVIFDEASQVRVADALGAIMRGKQVIVVGDTKQMPPTSFFGKQLVLDDEEAEESLTADMESILGMFLASGTPEEMLKWHYRSRHESLIAVSNQEFYDNKLMIFPSSGINPQAKGLSFNYLPNTTYDRGGSRSNIGEATAVAEAVIKHAKTTPNQTLGVVTFSTAQRDVILLEVERLRKANPDLEHFFGDHEEGEDFFVKNLENVQGDERDTIYISIGYGKTNERRLPMSFGPLNSDGGERRLNVLISRARMCMEVFSNFKGDEMPTTEASPFGVRALKNFLYYAETGDLIKREETGKAPDSPFEEEVISSIRSLGYQVQPQVGCAGFYIDIAVRDPNKPGRYMLAVECDGATYHSSKSARDRDRIRQSVLEGLGWRFHRIWSTDWFRNRHKETERLDNAIKSAIAYYEVYDSVPVVEEVVKSKPRAAIERVEVEYQASASVYQVFPIEQLYLGYGDSIPDANTTVLAEDILKVVELESPIHVKHLTIRLLSAVGSLRSGARINRSILDGIGLLNRQGKVELDAEFIIAKSQGEITIRSRIELPSNERKYDLIYDGEIAKAAVDTVKDTFSISSDDLVKSITEVLGFSSTSKAMKFRTESVLAEQVESGHLTLKGDTYQVF
jgi:very-short-patch-repair endonuclease/DNA polymerase III delta prime subunit